MKQGKFEKAYQELEEILRTLEDGSISLDESLECYERGVKALKACHRMLDDAEKKIEILVRDTEGEMRAESFSGEEAGRGGA